MRTSRQWMLLSTPCWAKGTRWEATSFLRSTITTESDPTSILRATLSTSIMICCSRRLLSPSLIYLGSKVGTLRRIDHQKGYCCIGKGLLCYITLLTLMRLESRIQHLEPGLTTWRKLRMSTIASCYISKLLRMLSWGLGRFLQLPLWQSCISGLSRIPTHGRCQGEIQLLSL